MFYDEPVIRVDGLSKCYHVYAQPQDRLKQLVLPGIQRLMSIDQKRYYREFWALKDVSLQVWPGETVGIIGRNGSGKSTLLQMICGTLEPTSGVVEIRGRVAALLELGAGFNPEFTGRENVYLNAAVLGLSENEVRTRFDEILQFADIGDFIDQPVKHYSSGMYARLAFSVAINVDPNILVVDEALAVGDEPFQRKCFAKIEEIKRNGSTILFVSHSSSAIVALCDRAVFLHSGKRLFTGSPKTAVSWYAKLMNAPESGDVISQELRRLELEANVPDSSLASSTPDHLRESDTSAQTALKDCSGEEQDDSDYDIGMAPKSTVVYEPNGAIISNPRIETLDGKVVNVLVSGRRYRICYAVNFETNAINVRFYSIIKTIHGFELGGGTYPIIGQNGVKVQAHQETSIYIEFCCNLSPDTYFFNCGVASNNVLMHRILDAGVFRVIRNSENSVAIGTVDLCCTSFTL